MPALELTLPQITSQDADGTINFNASGISTIAASPASFMIFYLTEQDEQNGYGTVIQLDEQHKASIYPDLNPEYTYLFYKNDQGQLQTLLWCIEFSTKTNEGLYIIQAKVHGRGVTEQDMQRFNQIMLPSQPAAPSTHTLSESYASPTTPPTLTQQPAVAAQSQQLPPQISVEPAPLQQPSIAPQETAQVAPVLESESPAPQIEQVLDMPDLLAAPSPSTDLEAAPQSIVAASSSDQSQQTDINLPPLPPIPPDSSENIPTPSNLMNHSAPPVDISFPTLPPLPPLPSVAAVDQSQQNPTYVQASPQTAFETPIQTTETTQSTPVPQVPQLDQSTKNPVGRPPKPLLSDASWSVDQSDFAWAKSVSRDSIIPNQEALRQRVQQQIQRNQPDLLQNEAFQTSFNQAFSAVCQTYELTPTARQDILKSLLNGRIVENLAKTLN